MILTKTTTRYHTTIYLKYPWRNGLRMKGNPWGGWKGLRPGKGDLHLIVEL